ncbi:MAG: methyltransferase domain-containing protein [Baekduiaceae bacterium]
MRLWPSRHPVLTERFPPPEVPFTEAYGATHVAFLQAMLADEELLGILRGGKRLPRGYGVALDERVVEFPWLLAQQPRGRVLDAGSVLNHPHVLDAFLPVIDTLTIATLVTEPHTFPERGVTYVESDLRTMPFDDDAFDTVICASTVEHIGMDNTMYGSDEPRADDPPAEQRRAIAELLRVTAPGGRVFLTVPFGLREDHGWFRQLNHEDLVDLLSEVPPDRRTVEIFGYDAKGWQRRRAGEVAGHAYRDVHADPRPVADRAAAARAVACITISA